MQQIIYAKERFSETLKEFLFMFIKLFFFWEGGICTHRFYTTWIKSSIKVPLEIIIEILH